MHRSRKILRGFRRHQRRQLPEVRRQGSQACEEEEDQERDQNPAELGRRPQRCCTARCRARLSGEQMMGLMGMFGKLWMLR